MSAFGSTLNFGVKIGVQDDSRRGTASFLSNIQSMARTAIKPITIPLQIGRGALGLLRDINLGLAPVVRGLDHLLTRGGALEVQQKAFESLSGRSGRQAEYLARRLQEASSGTLRLGEAMALANRAMSSGMNLDQLAVAIEFIGKKSVATGKDARQALDTVITGLIRGSTLFLDDFGILVDGLDGVKRSFDSMHGRGAFESLGPAAQKAETVRQAIEEMRGQMGAINISGRETVFLYTGIKTQIGDAVDRLVLAVAKSDAMKGALISVRDTLAGISQHFSEINLATGKTGTFEQLLFGKGGSAGLWGVIKGFMLDAGEALGRGMIGGALVAIGAMPSVLRSAGDLLSEGITSAVSGGILRGINSLFGDKGNPLEMAGDALLRSGTVDPKTIALMREFNGTASGQPALEAVATGKFLQLFEVIDTLRSIGPLKYMFRSTTGNTPARDPEPPPYDEMVGLPYGFGFGIGLTPGTGTPAAAARAAENINKFILTRRPSRISDQRAPSIFERMHAAGREILSNGIFGESSRGLDALRMFQTEFKGKGTDDLYSNEALQERLGSIRGELPLSARGRAMRRGEQNLAERELRRVGAQTFREARRLAGEEARRLRRQGFVVDDDKQDEIRKTFQDRLFAQRAGGALTRRAEAAGDLARDDKIAEILADAAKAQMKAAEQMSASVTRQEATVNRLTAAFTGAENELAAIAGKN